MLQIKKRAIPSNNNRRVIMVKAGGIIGIIAGVMGIIAAFITLFFGGVASFFGGSSAGGETVVWLGWGGILFSFLVVIFAALSFAKPKVSGIALILSSVGGIFLGGTIVAIFMGLSLISGILVAIGGRKTLGSGGDVLNKAETGQDKGSRWKKTLVYSGIAVGVIIVLAIIAGVSSNKKPGIGHSGKDGGPASEISRIESAQIYKIDPYGELAAMFSIGSNHTNVQRENALKELKGKIVAWQLPVYEVSKQGDGYRVQTSAGRAVGTFIHIKTRNDQEKSYLESIKTGDTLSFKGVIADVDLTRHLIIRPAILLNPAVHTAAQAASSKNSQAGLAGKYVLKDKNIMKELSVQQLERKKVRIALFVSTEGCTGEIEKAIVPISNNVAVFNGEGNCKLTIRFDKGKASVQEEMCTYYRGAACDFDGVYERTE